MRKVCIDNCLATLNQKVASEWHPTKNGNITPYVVFAQSNKKFWFKCAKNHEWEAALSQRCSKKNTGCPYCNGRKVCVDNCLATLNPKIANEWHPIKNGEVTPFNVVAKSNKKFWFKCIKCHEWEVSLNNRCSNGTECPFCTNQRVCIDNCLATLNPKVAGEWHPAKNGNVTPHDVIVKSAKKYWFKCAKGHDWKASLHNRCSLRGRGCPKCDDSKGIKKIIGVLENLDVRYKREVRFKTCKNIKPLPFDLIISPVNKDYGAIEYQGQQHYLPVPRFGGTKALAGVQTRDAIKRKFCLDKKLALLEISYQDFNNIEKIVNEFIDSLPHPRKKLQRHNSCLTSDSACATTMSIS